MNISDVFKYGVLALFLAQGLLLTIAPERAVAYQMWKHRLIGAKPAEPGPGTVFLYRIGGFVLLVASTFILIIQLFSE